MLSASLSCLLSFYNFYLHAIKKTGTDNLPIIKEIDNVPLLTPLYFDKMHKE
jgi:hypothetical protein